MNSVFGRRDLDLLLSRATALSCQGGGSTALTSRSSSGSSRAWRGSSSVSSVSPPSTSFRQTFHGSLYERLALKSSRKVEPSRRSYPLSGPTSISRPPEVNSRDRPEAGLTPLNERITPSACLSMTRVSPNAVVASPKSPVWILTPILFANSGVMTSACAPVSSIARTSNGNCFVWFAARA